MLEDTSFCDPRRWHTSATYLKNCLRKRTEEELDELMKELGELEHQEEPETAKGNPKRIKHERIDQLKLRCDLMTDVHIKTTSYACLNKIMFPFALATSLLVVTWPALAVISDSQLLDSSVLQTTITAAAAFFIYIYRHYKVKQAAAENIMRYIAFSSAPIDELLNLVMEKIGKTDIGFAFKSITKEDEGDGQAKKEK